MVVQKSTRINSQWPCDYSIFNNQLMFIIQLSQFGDGGGAICVPDIVRKVVNDKRIIKVGVGLDDDAIDLYKWSMKSCSGDINSYQRNNTRIFTMKDILELIEKKKQKQNLWAMTSRFDLGKILPNRIHQQLGIKTLAQQILGVTFQKPSKMIRSNWNKSELSTEQVAYAARDAWVSAAVVDRLQRENNEVFCYESLMEMDFLKYQMKISTMAAKLDAKRKLRRKKQKEEVNAQDRVRWRNFICSIPSIQYPTFDDDDLAMMEFFPSGEVVA